jgi:hypothetical protein
VQGFEIAEELDGVGANGLGLFRIDAVTAGGGEHALPALMFELAVGLGAGVLLGQHLGQDAVAQAEGRVAEAGQGEALQQLGEDLGAGHDDLGALGSDAGHGLALGEGHLGQPGAQLADVFGNGCSGCWADGLPD